MEQIKLKRNVCERERERLPILINRKKFFFRTQTKLYIRKEVFKDLHRTLFRKWDEIL